MVLIQEHPQFFPLRITHVEIILEISYYGWLNIVADDVIEYVKFAGREIRFARILSHQDNLAPVS
jgi:hypothetical protein